MIISQQNKNLSSGNGADKDYQKAALMLIDPNEPVYCYCQQSLGKMIACDNVECEIDWFHLPCVGLKAQPKGKWYCPYCIEKLELR